MEIIYRMAGGGRGGEKLFIGMKRPIGDTIHSKFILGVGQVALAPIDSHMRERNE